MLDGMPLEPMTDGTLTQIMNEVHRCHGVIAVLVQQIQAKDARIAELEQPSKTVKKAPD